MSRRLILSRTNMFIFRRESIRNCIIEEICFVLCPGVAAFRGTLASSTPCSGSLAPLQSGVPPRHPRWRRFPRGRSRRIPVIQAIDTIETFRDMLSAMQEIYLSSVGNRMNQVMKVLTIIATIFIPMTFLAGIYGMNFKYMPELEWRYAYLVFWLVVVTVFIIMIALFKKKKWL